MKLFMPDRVVFDPPSLRYPLGEKIYGYFQDKDVEVIKAPLQKVAGFIPGTTAGAKYASSKKTLAVTVKKSLKLDVCRPSADFEFSLVTGCPGNCEYCYLYTTQSSKLYLRTYVNLEEIFTSIREHIVKNGNRLTTFEVASAGDPLAIEHITGSLSKTVEFFGELENARLRVVTKFDNVDPLLTLRHNGHTRFRVSINSRYVIDSFEHTTAGFDERIDAASKIADAGYPIGFIVAPIMVYDRWEKEYLELFDRLKRQINTGKSGEPVTFELIQHRFTPAAKKFILERFPNTKLDMEESRRVLKWGKFGRFKYVYPAETASHIKEYIQTLISERFPGAVIEYFT
ncbi:MAG: spore photoproduct lyase [Clostridiales bacterium]|nr:spore photoproduct lyase [Eubacteriales bacterium]MDH7567268.1 spore photoproduct lyase [Clostridiales bacterium]